MITLRTGRRSPDVERWQRFLTSQQLLIGRADGIFGRATESATRTFQEREGLQPDGVVGPKTIARAREIGFVVVRRMHDSDLDSDLIANATRILQELSEAPFGTESVFELRGNRYVARIEQHYHPIGGPRRPWGYHAGVSLFREIGTGVDEPVHEDT